MIPEGTAIRCRFCGWEFCTVVKVIRDEASFYDLNVLDRLKPKQVGIVKICPTCGRSNNLIFLLQEAEVQDVPRCTPIG